MTTVYTNNQNKTIQDKVEQQQQWRAEIRTLCACCLVEWWWWGTTIYNRNEFMNEKEKAMLCTLYDWNLLDFGHDVWLSVGQPLLLICSPLVYSRNEEVILNNLYEKEISATLHDRPLDSRFGFVCSSSITQKSHKTCKSVCSDPSEFLFLRSFDCLNCQLSFLQSF